METSIAVYAVPFVAALVMLKWTRSRLRLSKAKHPSLRGHSRIARLVAKLVCFYEYDEARFFACDAAPDRVAAARRAGFERLCAHFRETAPKSIESSASLEAGISDVLFTNTYRVPFQFRRHVKDNLEVGSLVEASSGTRIKDLDGNWSYDLSGSYGVNVFGYDFYKECIDRGVERVRDLGPVLGPYHPVIVENVARLKAISGHDEVSFHMSGTEAVMQAVRLARFHTGRSHLVRFCGAYHGWWDGVQPGLGNQRTVDDVYTLKDMDPDTLAVLRTRRDIACVLVNPVQGLHPNADAPGDATLVNSERGAHFDREAYTRWLQELRRVCTDRGIVLIFDEVMLGFRLSRGGAQAYFGVRADLVTYGKTLGGGLPVGAVCGRHDLMRRFRDDRPTQICFARGTFNSHPYVMGAMNEFLRRLDQPRIEALYASADRVWNDRAGMLNERLAAQALPVRVVNFSSVWTTVYTAPSRYNWMFQYYLRAQGLAVSWIGTGRLIFSLDFPDEDFEDVAQRFVAAARAMQADQWWWRDPALTNRSIKRQVFRELVSTGLRRLAGAGHRPAAAGESGRPGYVNSAESGAR